MTGLKYDFRKDMSLEDFQEHAQYWVNAQKLVNWAIGDIAIKARAMSEDTLYQVFPADTSPGLIARCEAVSRAYPASEDRNELATWTQHMQASNKPDRIARVQAAVDAGLTSDESRKTVSAEKRSRWLLAVDCNYWLVRTFKSGGELDAGDAVAKWIRRTVDRLAEKNLSDAVMCFDSLVSFRKELTKDWEDGYKGNRDPKEPELIHQLHTLWSKLEADGFQCVTIEGFEGDDLLASYAAQFDGKVSLLAYDKDLHQAMSGTCNMLRGVQWTEDPVGEMIPEYAWYAAGPSERLQELRAQRAATEDEDEELDSNLAAAEHPNLLDDTGIRPDQWAEMQTITGDSVDNVKGAIGIGVKGGADLILEFGTLDSILEAAHKEDERIKPKKREALIQLAERLDVVRQLVTLRNDLEIPMDTRV